MLKPVQNLGVTNLISNHEIATKHSVKQRFTQPTHWVGHADIRELKYKVLPLLQPIHEKCKQDWTIGHENKLAK